jgi:hypothetical protein
LIVPLNVRASHAVLTLNMLLKSTATLRSRLPKRAVLNTRRSMAVRASRRSEPSGSTLTVVLPPTVCAVFTWRVTAMPLCMFTLPARPMSYHGVM